MPETASDPLGGLEQVKSLFVKFNKIGDFIKGTLVDVREVESQLPDKKGEMQKIYELKAELGQYHETDDQKQVIEPPVLVEAGEFYSIGGKPGIDAQMRRVKKGQIVAFKFTESKPSKTKGFSATKVIKVFVGGIDPTYHEDGMEGVQEAFPGAEEVK
jgi:hypothetical protein